LLLLLLLQADIETALRSAVRESEALISSFMLYVRDERASEYIALQDQGEEVAHEIRATAKARAVAASLVPRGTRATVLTIHATSGGRTWRKYGWQ
jgi:hypothetical protein